MAARKTDRRRRGDDTPITGGLPMPASFRHPIPSLNPMPEDPLTLHLLRLLALHPQVVARYNGLDVLTLDIASKEQLLKDVNTMLNIKPFRNGTIRADNNGEQFP